MAYYSTIACKQIFMRKIIFLSTLVIAFFMTAFKPIAGLDNVINALKTGNAQELSKYIDDNVEISLPDKSDNYSRAQALMVLKDFFNNGFVDENKVTDALIGISLFLFGALFINAVSFLVDGISKER